MKKLISFSVSAGLGLWLSHLVVPGVLIKLYPDSNLFGIILTGQWQIFLVLGIVLGLINLFLKPVLKTVTLPLRIITLGIFGLAINIFLIWLLDKMFRELSVPLWLPLLYTTLIIFALDIIIQKFLLKNNG
ncbi:MAG: phage holin family protein [Candidatus Staskawiczbacteria bacterium]|nr:phage holin family protein [Candidatus Staskawiczbacteria bacterium]